MDAMPPGLSSSVPRYAPIRPLWRACARLQRTSADTFVTPAGAGGRRSTRRQEEQDGPQRWSRAATPHRAWVVQPHRTPTPRSCACVACHSARNLAPPTRAFRGRAWRMLASRFCILASNGRLVERTPPWRGVVVLAPPSSFKEDTGPPSEFGLREHRRLPQGASPGASMYVPERFETIHVSLVLAPAAFMPAYDPRTSSPFAQRFSKI